MMNKALEDLEAQRAPQNTEYIVLEPQFKNVTREYLTTIDDIKTGKDQNDSHKIMQSINSNN